MPRMRRAVAKIAPAATEPEAAVPEAAVLAEVPMPTIPLLETVVLTGTRVTPEAQERVC
jgi:hypothetical protein